ncbi:hypothetical protein GCM10023322_66380 [Rugosimonospora acidiphila]|uniref:DUF3040 domain-containing protein n=1 Tax=Rugosimonospora acidiphila TaxID=556531 RepID=A0ABP9SK67_9ACTN
MSKERAARRAVRLAEAQREQAARERAATRRARRRALVRRVTPRLPDRRTGRLYPRRTRAQRAAIGLAALVAIALVWMYVEDLGARIALTALVIVALPAIIVLTFDRR